MKMSKSEIHSLPSGSGRVMVAKSDSYSMFLKKT